MNRFWCGSGLLVFCMHLWAQGSESVVSGGQFTFNAGVEGSSSRLGSVTRLDASAGYRFHPQWSVDFGVPYYFISPSNSTATATGSTSANGLGNVYTRIRFMSLHPAV